ncbi:MAG TPA: tyrosine--tRNA ligase [Candidatus Saccharimonadales bacterium]|nr:tyrosine--tRNA ligase [Candidatus Saccharimonadales bacterium]
MNLSQNLTWRGLIKDKTFQDVGWLDEPKTFYLGVDCNSADSLAIGNLAVFMLARHLAEAGWKTVLLVGGATSLIGDPGGKDEERPLKSREEVAANVAAIKEQVRRLFAHNQFELVDNYDWFKDIGYLEFLRDVGKHFSMTELVQRDFIATRMGEGGGGISYAEFSYNLIQGYDYYWLHKNKGVVLQIGGSDQWGNMLSGAPLIRKKEGAEVHALSMPLIINKATGKKFGKSEAGAVWLDPAKTTPTQFYQFWINCDDAAIEDYFKYYTMLSREEIEQIVAQHAAKPAERHAQRRLAQEVTAMVHGERETRIAEQVTNYIIGKSSVGEASDEALEALRKEMPTAKVTDTALLADVLVTAGLTSSKSEALRLLADNAIYINGTATTKAALDPSDFQNGRLLIRKGKVLKNTALIERM